MSDEKEIPSPEGRGAWWCCGRSKNARTGHERVYSGLMMTYRNWPRPLTVHAPQVNRTSFPLICEPPRQNLKKIAYLFILLLSMASLSLATAQGSLQFAKKGHVTCGDLFNVPEGTLEFWFKPSTSENNEWVLSKKSKDSGMELGFGPSELNFMVKKDGDWSYVGMDKAKITMDAWHHVACVFTKDSASLYLNGEKRSVDRAGRFGLDHLKGGEFRIGCGSSEYPERFNGMVAEVRLSNVMRYTADFASPSTPFSSDRHTVALWRFDEEQGDEVRDASGNGHNGKVVGVVTRSKESPFGSVRRMEGAEFGFLPCLRVKQPPAIDGKPDDLCWQRAAQATGFLTLGSNGWILAPRQTLVRAVYDDRAVYLFAVCLEPEMNKINAGVATRDGPVYDDDCLEIFLDVSNERSGYFQYVFNALGTYYDGHREDKSWDSTISVATDRLEDRWTLEAAVPFSELRIPPPAEGDLWGFNAAREHRLGNGLALSTWSVLPGGSFHKPQEYGRLRFVGDAFLGGSRDFSNCRVAIRNPAFSEVTPAGAPVGWNLGEKTVAKETAYLSGAYNLVTDSDHLAARQEMNLRNVAGRTYELTVSGRGDGEAQLGIVVQVETAEGKPQPLPVLWDLPLSGSFETHRKRFVFPTDTERVTSVELYRSNRKGTLYLKEVNLSDLTEFHEVREASEELASYRRPLGEPFVSPCLRWGNPLSGGPVSVLFLVDFGGVREVVELAQRMEMNYDVVWSKGGSWYAWGASRINARLSRKAKPYDVIVLSVPVRSQDFCRVIRDNLTAGTGLVYLQQDSDSAERSGLHDLLPKLTELSRSEPDLARHIPWRHLPTMARNYVDSGRVGEPSVKSMGIGIFDKGKIITLGYGGPGGVSGLLPWACNNYTDLDRWWEYVYSLVAKSILAAANRVTSAQIATTEVTTQTGTISVTVKGTPGFKAVLIWRWTDKLHVAEGFEDSTRFSIAAEGSSIAELKVPESVRCSRGVHLANLTLKDAEGETVDWTTVTLPVETSLRLNDGFPFRSDWLKEGEKIEATVVVENNGDKPASVTLTAELVDSYGRVVWSETRPVALAGGDKSRVSLTPSPERALTVYHDLRVTLSNKEGVIDRQSWPLFLPDRWEWVGEDFRCGVSCDYFVRSHTDRAFTEWFQSFGMSFTSEGGSYDAGPRDNMPWHHMNLIWQPLHNSSRKSLRQPCFSDPAAMAQIVDQAVSNYAALRKYAPYFCTMGDEAELVRDGTAEVCFCSHCASRFRQWARDRHGSLEKLNVEWGTKLGSWEEVAPITAEEARQRGNYAQWVDFRTFMEDVWVGGFLRIKEGIRRTHPQARLGFTNPFILNPFSGEDHYKSARAEDAFGKYARFDLTKEYRSFNPNASLHTYYGYGESVPCCRWYPWWFALNGGDFLVWWTSLRAIGNSDLFDITGRHTPRSLATLETIPDLVNGLGKILRDFPPTKNDVAMLYSQNSMHVSWIESDMKVGDAPWASAGMDDLSPSNPFFLNYKSREHFKGLLKETGSQPDFIAPEQIEAGKLKDYRLLILPCASALSESLLARVTEFVKAGGTVLADLRAGLYSEHGRLIAQRPTMEGLFGFERDGTKFVTDETCPSYSGEFAGIPAATGLDRGMGRESLSLTTGKNRAKYPDGTPAVIVNTVGRGKAVYLNFVPGFGRASQTLMNRVLDMAQTGRSVRLLKDRKPAFGYDHYLFERGPVRYLGVLRDMPPLPKGERSSWSNYIVRNATGEKETIIAKLPAPCHVYDVRAGKYLGKVSDFSIQLPPSTAGMFGLLPYRVKDVTIGGVKPTYRAGEDVQCQFSVVPEGGKPGDHVVRMEVYGPDGILVRHYSRNLLALQGRTSVALPLALKERPGRWKIKLIDVTSKVSRTAEFLLKQGT